MATTGDTLGGTAVSTAKSGGTNAWNIPSNALVDSTSAASCGSGTLIVSHWLQITNFGFSIPTGATINGITVKVRRRCSSSNDWLTTDVRLVNSGVLLGTAKFIGGSYWPSIAAVETIGGASDLWGWTPVIATINSSTFGVQFSGEDDATGSDTAYVEALWMNITYTEAAGPIVSKSTMMFF